MKSTSLFNEWGQEDSETDGDIEKTKLVHSFRTLTLENPGRYQEAVNLFAGTKYENDPDVLFTIGLLYNDVCTKQFFDPDKALEYFERAYNAGNPAAKEHYLKTLLGNLEDPANFAKAKSLGSEDKELQNFLDIPDFLAEEICGIIKTLKEEQVRLMGTARGGYCPIFDAAAQIFAFNEKSDNRYEKALEHLDLVTRWNKPVSVLEKMSEFVANSESPYHNQDKAEALATTLLTLYEELFPENNDRYTGAECFKLVGFNYYTGETCQINPERSLFWFEKARKYGDIQALEENILAVLIKFDPRRSDTTYQDYHTEILQRLEKLHEDYPDAACWGKLKLAEYYMSGKVMGSSKEVGMSLYKKIHDTHFDETYTSTKFHAIGVLAIRTFLGLDIDSNPTEAANLIKGLPRKKDGGIICHGCNGTFSDCLKEIAKIESSAENYKTFNAASTLIRDVYEGKVSFEDAKKHFLNNLSYINETTIRLLDLVKYLSYNEGWVTSNQWRDLSLAVQSAIVGLNPMETRLSALSVGPRYNPVARNGLPILGAWEPPTERKEDVEQQIVSTGAFVPQSGIIRFSGLTAEQHGSIKFKFEAASDKPALILPDDVEVLMVLAFGKEGGDQEVIWPSLSLETMDSSHWDYNKTFRIETPILEEKYYNPRWLGYTNFGKTLFYTDYLIGSIAWEHNAFSIANDELAIFPGFSKFASDFIYDLAMTGGDKKDGMDKRIMLRPAENIYIDHRAGKMKQTGNPAWEVTCNNAPMRIDGAYMSGEDRSIALNDTHYMQGRLTQKITDRYDDVAMMLPVFERARQLVGMQYSLFKLRELGYRPSPNEQALLTDRLKQYEALPPLPLSERIMSYVPF